MAAHGADLYFRPVAGGNFPAQDGIYTWDTTTSDWYTDLTGGTSQTWSNANADIASLPTTNLSATGAFYTVELATNITVGGIMAVGTVGSATSRVDFTSSDSENPVTLTFTGDAEIDTVRHFRLSNLNITGNFSVTSGNGSLQLDSGLNFVNSTITVEKALYLNAATNASVYLNSGSDLTLNAGTASIARLEGAIGSDITRTSPGSGGTLTIDQNDTTAYHGSFTGTAFNFKKAGTGTLIFTNSADIADDRHINVDGGSFYVNGNFTGLRAGFQMNIADGANLGGDFETVKRIVLDGASSTLTAGMPDLLEGDLVFSAGTIVVAGGMVGGNGGTFSFYMDGEESLALANSRIDVTGGTLTLDGTKTVNLFGMNAGLLQTGVAYTLFDADGADTFTAGWNNGWVLGQNTTGFAIQTFGFVGNELQVVFVPEPGVAGMVLAGLGVLLAMGLAKKRRRSDG